MKSVEPVIGFLCIAGAVLGGVAMLAMMVQVGADVTLKYLFNHPIRFTLEMVSSYYMVALVFLPLGLVTRDDGHVVVELFTQGFGPRAMALINGLAGLLALAYIATMTVESAIVAWERTLIREAWESATVDIQVWPARWFLPIGCGLMTLCLMVQVVDNLRVWRGGARLAPASHDGRDGL